MKNYTFKSHGPKEVTVRAPDEAEARRLAMVSLYGEKPHPITPEAPNYKGLGLLLLREVPV